MMLVDRPQILPVVDAHTQRWPKVDAKISFNDRYVEVIEKGIDVAVQLGGTTVGWSAK
jgi:DNA-binding transcriptional LysR family regulator